MSKRKPRKDGVVQAPRCTVAEKEQRIETCRKLLIRCRTKGDIKRLLSKEWDISGAAVGRYIDLARKRNAEQLDKSSDQNLSESISDWADMRQEYEVRIVQAKKDIQQAGNAIQRCDGVLSSRAATQSDRKAALSEKELCVGLIKNSRTEIANCQFGIKTIRREIDKLVGNRAPVKHAQTTSDGQDVDEPADSEPLTHESLSDNILEIGELLRKRGATPDPAGGNGKPKHVGSNGNGNGNGQHN